MKTPLVSVVITTYERNDFVKRAIRSVLAQTYEPIEVIVVEDGSNSDIEKWIEEYAPGRVRYLRHNDNKGLAAARNTGLQNSKGRYVAYIDDDDEWMPDKLLKQVRLFETQEEWCGVVYCGAVVLSADGRKVCELKPQMSGDIRRTIGEKGLFTIPSTCLFTKEALSKIGGYDETLRCHVDHDIWLRLAKGGYEAGYIDEYLVRLYEHQEPRVTENVRLRVEATTSLCNKWRVDLEDWLGPTESRRYLARFTARVMAMLGWALFWKGHGKQAARFFVLALRHTPTERHHYVGLIACMLGRDMYDRVSGIWNRYNGIQQTK